MSGTAVQQPQSWQSTPEVASNWLATQNENPMGAMMAMQAAQRASQPIPPPQPVTNPNTGAQSFNLSDARHAAAARMIAERNPVLARHSRVGTAKRMANGGDAAERPAVREEHVPLHNAALGEMQAEAKHQALLRELRVVLEGSGISWPAFVGWVNHHWHPHGGRRA